MGDAKTNYAGALIVAPPSASGSPWLRRFGEYSDALASGWMQVRGNRRRRGLDRGFVISDHADWPGLLEAIAATGAEPRAHHPRLRRGAVALSAGSGLDARPLRPLMAKKRRPEA